MKWTSITETGADVSQPQIFKDEYLQCALVLKGFCAACVFPVYDGLTVMVQKKRKIRP